jgi:hypothetical protein
MAWSPYKDSVVNFVAANPGCTKWAVAQRVTNHPRRHPSKQYYIVNTAIRNGWIRAEWRGNKYALFVPETK